MKYILITEEFLVENSNTNAWNALQLKQIGVVWPPYKGWKKDLIGTQITEEKAALFIGYGVLGKRKNK